MPLKFLKVHKKAAWVCFFILIYLGILIWKFFSLVSLNEILPGNDTLGHFWAFHEFFQGLSSGHFWQYSTYWFGGMPLFQFYAPLGFLLMSGVYALIGHFVSQFLVFRWYVFLTFAVFPVPFYFFVKNYAGQKAAYFSLPLGLLLVFYPPFFNFLGLGAASAIVGGLFDQMLAVDFLLFYLVALKKLVDSDRLNWKWIAWGGIALALVFLSHTLTSIMAGVLTFLIGVFYVKRWFKNKLFYNFAGVILVGFLLSAFWLVPFIANLKFTSAEAISTGSFLSSPLEVFAPFHLNDIWNGGGASFSYIWILIWAAFAVGVVRLVKERKSLIPVILLVIFLVFGLDYFNSAFSDLTLHYYRMLGYGLIFFLAIAAVGASWLWENLIKKKILLSLAVALCLAAFLQYLYFFRFTGELSTVSSNNGVMSVGQLTDINYFWSITQYPSFGKANAVLSDLRGNSLSMPQRVMPDMSPFSMMNELSSVHFFNATLPFVDNESSLFGLYAESSWQLPFIFPTSNIVTGNGMLWGRVRDLSFDTYFQGQGLEDMVKRLQLFGIDRFLTGSPVFDEQAEKIKEATLIKNDNGFKIYRLSGAKPLVYEAGHMPGLFVRYGGLDFREFALGWYSVPDLLDYPVADWTKGANDLTASSTAPFSFIAVELNGRPSDDFVKQITSLGKPVVFLNESGNPLSLGNGKNIEEVDAFQPVALFGKQPPNMTQPNVDSLTALSGFIHKFAAPNANASTTLSILSFSGENVSFSGAGPAIVNLGYFPYWQCKTGCGNVYPVTPGQMLIFSNGYANLAYRPSTDAAVGEYLSIFGVVLLIGAGYLARRQSRKKETA